MGSFSFSKAINQYWPLIDYDAELQLRASSVQYRAISCLLAVTYALIACKHLPLRTLGRTNELARAVGTAVPGTYVHM